MCSEYYFVDMRHLRGQPKPNDLRTRLLLTLRHRTTTTVIEPSPYRSLSYTKKIPKNVCINVVSHSMD